MIPHTGVTPPQLPRQVARTMTGKTEEAQPMQHTYRAMQVTELGAALEPRDVAVPVPGPGQVRVRVHACGLNFGDLLIVAGTYQEKRPVPFTPGMEVAATVEAVGDGVTTLSAGDRVAAYCGFGGFAEVAILDAATCIPLPDSMDDITAAAFLIAYGTSHVALHHRAGLKPGERLLVLGASGGIGLTAVELGRLAGAEVIACARGADKLQVCASAGAHHLIDSADADIRNAVKSLGGADVVYDPIGGDQFKAALRACNPEARILPLGFASGDVPQVPANIILVKNISVLGFYWGGYASFAPHVLRDSFAALLDLHGAGKIKPHVSHVLPLAAVNDGLDLLRTRTATGKVVVTMAP